MIVEYIGKPGGGLAQPLGKRCVQELEKANDGEGRLAGAGDIDPTSDPNDTFVR